MFKKIFITTVFVSVMLLGQDKAKRHEFEIITKVPATEVKSQDKTGTCWAFATASFLESELLRMNKGKFNLSEMFIARKAYDYKTEKYFRYHGDYNMNEGGQAHDFLIEMEENGLIPESAYSGLKPGDKKHNHSEMWSVMKGIMDAVVKKKVMQTESVWPELIQTTMDLYLGKIPNEFEYEGKKYTPKEFKEYLGLNKDDYIEFTSYTNYPYYEAVDLEVPDNYRHELYYNLPLEEFMEVINYALNNGYSVDWDGSVVKPDFDKKKGYGIVHADESENDEEENDKTAPEVEKVITVELRQQYFDNYKVNDDHLMHVTGLAKDQAGTKFYYTKNSWGTDEKGFDGYYYLSESYMRLRTMAIMVHKDAIPEKIMAKLKKD